MGDHLQAGRCFSHYECKQILAQTLEGLAYLHTLDPQIVHRDVKPNNILILYRRPDAILVKFADFGLSREGDNLKSICGTALYLAPEVYEADALRREERAAYTALVDIWSLGVVLAELLCGLPKHGGQQSTGVEWCKSVRQRVETMLEPEGDDLLLFVLESMLCLRPDARKTATDCLKAASVLLDRAQESNSRVSGGNFSDNLDNEASTIRPGEARNIDSEITEMGNGGASIGSSSLSTYIISDPQRHVRSCNAPSPEATSVHVGQLLSKFGNHEDILFYESSFGEDSDGRDDGGGESGLASTIVTAHGIKPQDEAVEGSPRPVLGFAAPPETDDVGDNAVKAMVEETGTCTSNVADAAFSFKRCRTSTTNTR